MEQRCQNWNKVAFCRRGPIVNSKRGGLFPQGTKKKKKWSVGRCAYKSIKVWKFKAVHNTRLGPDIMLIVRSCTWCQGCSVIYGDHKWIWLSYVDLGKQMMLIVRWVCSLKCYSMSVSVLTAKSIAPQSLRIALVLCKFVYSNCMWWVRRRWDVRV